MEATRAGMRFVVAFDFAAEAGDELDVETDEIVVFVEQRDENWFLVHREDVAGAGGDAAAGGDDNDTLAGVQGLVPASYLREYAAAIVDDDDVDVDEDDLRPQAEAGDEPSGLVVDDDASSDEGAIALAPPSIAVEEAPAPWDADPHWNLETLR